MQRKLESYGRLPSTLNSKGQGHPLTCLCGDRGEAEVQLQPIRSFGARMGKGFQHHAPAAFAPGRAQAG